MSYRPRPELLTELGFVNDKKHANTTWLLPADQEREYPYYLDVYQSNEMSFYKEVEYTGYPEHGPTEMKDVVSSIFVDTEKDFLRLLLQIRWCNERKVKVLMLDL